jgi:hypothetical protein
MNRLRTAMHGYDMAEIVTAHRVARNWWAAILTMRPDQFGRASLRRVARNFDALDIAIDAGDFEAAFDAWSLCERWVSCLDSTPANVAE